MRAKDRLTQFSGLTGVTAAAMLMAIGHGPTAGAILTNYSGLGSVSAAEHLMYIRQSVGRFSITMRSHLTRTVELASRVW